MMRPRVLLMGLLLVGALSSFLMAQEGYAACGDDGEPAFEQVQTYFNPATLGLPVGAPAPAIPGVTYPGRKTLVLAAHRTINPEYLPLLASWSELTELQFVLIEMSAQARISDDIASLGAAPEAVLSISFLDALPLLTMFRVGERAAPILFLVDESGDVVYRRRGFGNYAGLEVDRIVKAFAGTGTIPPDAIQQNVFWYDDPAPWPSFPLVDLVRQPVLLSPGRPILFYYGPSTGSNAPAFSAMETLRESHGESIEFIWLRNFKSTDAVSATWEFAHTCGIAGQHPEIHEMPLQDFLTQYDREAAFQALVDEVVTDSAVGWTVLIDIDNKLLTYWTICVSPSVLILDEDGTVVFPWTPIPVNLASGTGVLHPGVVPELDALIREMLDK